MRRTAAAAFGATIAATVLLGAAACTTPPQLDIAAETERVRLLAEWQRVVAELQSSWSLPSPVHEYPTPDADEGSDELVIRLYDVRDLATLIGDFPGEDRHTHSGE